MNTFSHRLFFVALITGWVLLVPLTGQDIQEKIRSLHQRYKIDPDQTGIYFTSLNSGRVLYKQNENRPFVPASNMKLITAFVALKQLEPDTPFTTELYVDQPENEPKNLYVRGGGDPTLSRRASNSHTAIFEEWARKLKKQGHDRFSGDLFLDPTSYERQIRHPSWDRYKHTFWYTAAVDALNYNDNCVLVTVTPGTPGHQANVSVKPEGAPVTIDNQTKTVREKSKAHIDFHRNKNTSTIEVSGGIYPNTARKEWITVPYPTTYFGAVLKRVFEDHNLPIRGNTSIKSVPDRLLETPPDLKRTTPLKHTLDRMLKKSQNLFAETILKQVAYQQTGTGSWSEASNIVRRTLENQNIQTQKCKFVDGSGLSRSNRLTPSSLVSVLQKWIHSDQIGEYISSLPISGVDGTMEHRLNNPPYRKDIAAKTGTLSGVKALSGIAGRNHLSKEGKQTILFSIIVNENDLPPGNARVFVDHVARVAHELTGSSD